MRLKQESINRKHITEIKLNKTQNYQQFKLTKLRLKHESINRKRNNEKLKSTKLSTI